MLRASTYFPDSFIRFLPVLTQPLKQAAQVSPKVIGDPIIAVVDIDSIHEFAIDIKLFLFIGSVANAHRSTIAIAHQVIESGFSKIVLAIDTVYWLQCTIFL